MAKERFEHCATWTHAGCPTTTWTWHLNRLVKCPMHESKAWFCTTSKHWVVCRTTRTRIAPTTHNSVVHPPNVYINERSYALIVHASRAQPAIKTECCRGRSIQPSVERVESQDVCARLEHTSSDVVSGLGSSCWASPSLGAFNTVNEWNLHMCVCVCARLYIN